MSTSVHTLDGYRVDAKALGLVALFTVVIGGALAIRPGLVATGTEPAFSGSSTSQQAATGAAWAVAEAVFAGLLLAGIVLWRWFPDWLQDALTAAVKFAGAAAVGVYGIVTGNLLLVFGVVPMLIALAHVTDAFDLCWLVNNLLAVGLAIYLAALVGITLGATVLGIGFVGLAVYDYAFADRASWMFELGAWTVRRKLPTLVIIPMAWRFDWERLADAMEGGLEDDERVMRFGIGMADLLLPAAFAVSLAGAGGAPLYGAVAGTLLACVRVSWKMEQGGGAGLPPLVTGALGGWAVAAGAGVMLA